MRKLTLPLSSDCVRSLSLGEPVLLSGIMYTARDAVHQRLALSCEPLPSGLDLQSAVLYHCGPVIIKSGGRWLVTAAGPTTSMREEPYMADIIAKYQIKAVIGKGGMGEKTAEACQKHACLYLHAVGGAAQVLAETIQEVKGVYFLEEFGAPEAVWVLQVKDFPALVTIDAHGQSLHAEVLAKSERKLTTLLANGGKTKREKA